MNVFVHVLRSAPDSHNLAVMFAPTGPTGTGGSLSPHYVRESQLIALPKEGALRTASLSKSPAETCKRVRAFRN